MNTCKQCGKKYEPKYKFSKSIFCSDACRKASSRSPQDYTAKDIRILSDEDIIEKFDWAKIGSLSEQYKAPTEWIERGFMACDRAGVPVEYFIDRYLKKDKEVPFHEGVDEAYRELFLRNPALRWRK